MKKTMGVWAAVLALAAATGPAARAAADVPTAVVSGYRGVSVPLSGSQMAFIKKGDRVDVMITFEARLKEGKEKVTATILQNVGVLDVQKPEKLDGKGAVELLCNPNEAQYLALSEMQGELSVAVRAEGDTLMKPMEMASLRKLFK
jgi:Flp pilus assembly protein CpaB